MRENSVPTIVCGEMPARSLALMAGWLGKTRGITLDSTGTAMSQQAKYGDTGPGADIDPAVCDHRRNEMPADR
jgi:hypothetical protein